MLEPAQKDENQDLTELQEEKHYRLSCSQGLKTQKQRQAQKGSVKV